MSPSAVYRPHAEGPAVATLSPETMAGAWEGLLTYRFEIISRGDFVPGCLHLPRDAAGSSPLPLLLVQHGLGQSRSAAALDFTASWVRGGLAVAAIDLPLHGERSSPKLSERLEEGVGRVRRGEPLDAQSRALVEEFARQSTSDLVRSLDALLARDEIASDRVGFLGFDLGAVIGCYLLAHDPRTRAAALIGAGAGGSLPSLDPARWLARARGVSVLVATGPHADAGSGDAAKDLFEAAPEPRRMATLSRDARTLDAKDADEIRAFFDASL
jgi:pimeloyl-ACP methyl ester carboxylesterase